MAPFVCRNQLAAHFGGHCLRTHLARTRGFRLHHDLVDALATAAHAAFRRTPTPPRGHRAHGPMLRVPASAEPLDLVPVREMLSPPLPGPTRGCFQILRRPTGQCCRLHSGCTRPKSTSKCTRYRQSRPPSVLSALQDVAGSRSDGVPVLHHVAAAVRDSPRPRHVHDSDEPACHILARSYCPAVASTRRRIDAPAPSRHAPDQPYGAGIAAASVRYYLERPRSGSLHQKLFTNWQCNDCRDLSAPALGLSECRGTHATSTQRCRTL